MINNKFFSTQNKNAIKGVINENILSKYKNTINNNYDIIIDETMKYVSSNVNDKPPKNMSMDEYLFLMNKKVYNIINPIIEKKEEKKNLDKKLDKNINNTKNINKNINNIENNIQNNIENNIENTSDKINKSLFDPLLLRNYETQTLMEYPKPSIIKNNNQNINIDVKKIEIERTPTKIKPIDFTIKNEKENKEDTMKLYNELLINYNDNKITPIDQLNETYENQNINEIINENEIETYVPTSNFISNTQDYNNDINTYNRNQILNTEFSSISKSSIDHLLIEPTFKLIEKKYHIIFDSLNRDLYEYPNPTSFQVKFSPSNNNFLYQSYYDDYNTLIIKEKNIAYGGNSDINIQETFDNIISISCTTATVPTNIIYYSNNATRNIYTEPYIYLVIPEIKGPYRGGNVLVSNAFSKLVTDESQNTQGNIVNNFFTNLKINENDIFLYSPVSSGKIDKMTLNILNKNGQYYNFGIDKLYIESFEKGIERYNSYCGESFISTIFTIQTTNDEYAKYCNLYYKNYPCNYLNSHPISISDKLYFYNTLPNKDEIAFLEDNIYVTKLKYLDNQILNIYLGYKKIINEKEKIINVSLQNIIPGGITNDQLLYKNYYIVFFDQYNNKYYYMNIVSFNNNYITVKINNYIPKFTKYVNIKIGITQKNLRGNNKDEIDSLFSNNGFIVLNIGDEYNNTFKIEINYPYDQLPEVIKNNYIPGNIFLIQDKLQISYSFTITTQIKDYLSLNSNINESGNN